MGRKPEITGINRANEKIKSKEIAPRSHVPSRSGAHVNNEPSMMYVLGKYPLGRSPKGVYRGLRSLFR